MTPHQPHHQSSHQEQVWREHTSRSWGELCPTVWVQIRVEMTRLQCSHPRLQHCHPHLQTRRWTCWERRVPPRDWVSSTRADPPASPHHKQFVPPGSRTDASLSTLYPEEDSSDCFLERLFVCLASLSFSWYILLSDLFLSRYIMMLLTKINKLLKENLFRLAAPAPCSAVQCVSSPAEDLLMLMLWVWCTTPGWGQEVTDCPQSSTSAPDLSTSWPAATAPTLT